MGICNIKKFKCITYSHLCNEVTVCCNDNKVISATEKEHKYLLKFGSNAFFSKQLTSQLN